MRPTFETVDSYLDIIVRMAVDGYDFCKLWSGFLAGVGWTEDEYEAEADRRIFPPSEAN
jgi:hypothetical protein